MWTADSSIVLATSMFYTADGGSKGVDEASARQAVVQAMLVVVEQYSTSATVPSGYVISQSPAAGTVVKVNTPVTIVVSTGAPNTVVNVTVPNCVGLYWKDATDLLQANFCSLDKYLWVVNAAAQGSVVSQVPASSTSVAPGTKVQLTLSAGAAKVPATVSVPTAS